MKKNTFSAVLLIQIAIGFYFGITGLLGVMGYNSGTNQLINDVNKLMGKTNYLPLIISILFLLVGVALIVGVVANIKNRFFYYTIFILWIVYIIITFFTNDFLKPETLVWLKNLSSELIVLAGLWATSQRKFK